MTEETALLTEAFNSVEEAQKYITERKIEGAICIIAWRVILDKPPEPPAPVKKTIFSKKPKCPNCGSKKFSLTENKTKWCLKCKMEY